MKAMDSVSARGAKHSDTDWYRDDLQRRHEAEGALSCLEISVPAY